MKYKIGLVTQTPIIKFNRDFSKSKRLNLGEISNNDYQYTVGGVSNMERVLIREFIKDNFAKKIYWFSLNPNAPDIINIDKYIRIINLKPYSKYLRNYTEFKEILWNNIHSISSEEFSVDSYLGYLNHNWIFTKKILENAGNFDIYYIHDFQQLMMGSMIGPIKPALLRWHVPFIPENFTEKIRKFIISSMEGFDGIIVSTKRDLEGLIRVGFKGYVRQVYPHINIEDWKKPSENEISEFAEKFNIKENDFLILNVARMDSIKSQDVLIKAFSKVHKKIKNAKLILVGNGSFTSSSNGLKSSKGSEWRSYLERLTNELKLRNNVIFTGYLPNEDLWKAYSRADLFVFPSKLEGFGLTVVESWLYGKCAVVSKMAGVSELITEELNGFTFKPGNIDELYSKIVQLYKNGEEREHCGKNAKYAAKNCYVTNTEPKIKNIINEVIDRFKKT